MRTPAEIDREFGVEKWGKLLERAEHTGERVTLETVDDWASEGASRSLVSVGSELVEMTPQETHAAYIDFIASVLEPFLPATALVELGCGYGSVILGLGKRRAFSGVPLFAADYTSAGPSLASIVAKSEGLSLTAGSCDLTSNPVTSLRIPPGSLVFTAYAAQYVEKLESGFVEAIAALRPRVAVHVEPVLEHCENGSVLGLLRRRYIEANGYNRNLVTLLHDEARGGRIRLLRETLPAFGPNPLLAASVIAWEPEEDSSSVARGAGG